MTAWVGASYGPQLTRPFCRLLRSYPQIPKQLFDALEPGSPEQRVPVATAEQWLHSAVELIGEPHLGLLAARAAEPGDFDVLEHLTASAPTWRAALDTFVRYGRLISDVADFRVEVADERAYVVLHSGVPVSNLGADYFNAAFFRACGRWLGEAPPELEIWFVRPEPADLSVYRSTFPIGALVFNAPFGGFAFDAARLEAPLASSDPPLHRMLQVEADRALSALDSSGQCLVAQVRADIVATLHSGSASAESTAQRLDTSRRTLSRRLRQQGTSFTALLQDVRRRSGARYLQASDRSVEEIAALLGFSESSAFVRAFKRWTGLAPLKYRRLHQRRDRP